MKTKSILYVLALSVFVLLCSSCGPLIFQAAFESDTVNNLPNSNPPGDPAGDEIKGTCGVKIINSTVFNSKAMRFFYEPNCGAATMWFEAAAVDANNQFLNYTFTGYVENSNHKDFYISFAGGHFKNAFKILYKNGKMYLTDGVYDKHDIGNYTVNQKQTFLVGLNRSSNQYNLSILRAGTTSIVLSDRPIKETAFWGVTTYILNLFYDIDDSNNSENGYVIDNVRINKEKN